MKLESTITDKAGFLYTAPLLDGVLLLLVFFALGSGFVLKSGVQIDLPTSGSGLPPSRNTHIVTIQRGSPPKVYFNESRVDSTQFQEELERGKSSSTQLIILADREADYGAVMDAASLALKSGYQVSFGTQPARE